MMPQDNAFGTAHPRAAPYACYAYACSSSYVKVRTHWGWRLRVCYLDSD